MTTTEDEGHRKGIPGATSPLVSRARLLNRLDTAGQRPLTLVTGPMGAGKTTLVAQWCREKVTGAVTWIDAHAHGSLTTAVADALASGPGLVVVDGVSSPEDAMAIAELARSLDAGDPSTARLVLIARRALTTELAPWRLDLRFDQLVAADLCLTPEELAELILQHVGDRPHNDLARALCQAIDGWAAGGVLLALNWVGGADLRTFPTVLSRGLAAAAAVAVTATLDGADDATQRLLERTACLPELGAALCDAVTGEGGSQAILRALPASGALLSTRVTGPDLVRLHPLARTGLMERGATTEAERTAMLATAARWYADHHLPLLAAAAHTALDEWEAAGEIAFAHLHLLEANGQIAELADHFVSLPVDVIQQNWDWVLFAVWMLDLRGDHGAAHALVSIAERGASPEHRVIAEYLRASYAAIWSDPGPALEAAERAMALCDQLDHDAEFGKLIGISRPAHFREMCRGLALLSGAYIGAWQRVAVHDSPLDPVVALELRPGEMSPTRARRAAHAAMSGDLATAEQEARTLFASGVLGDRHADNQAMQAHYALAEVRRGRGEYESVEPALAAAEERALARHIPNLLAAIAASRALLALDLHDPGRALEVLDQHRATTDHRPPPTVASMMTVAAARAHAALGRWELARDQLTRAPRTSAVAAALVVVLLDRGDDLTAEGVVAAWPDEGTVRSNVGRELCCAAISERRGLRREAVGHLRSALAAATPHGLLEPFLQMGIHLLGPFSHLVQISVEPGVSALAQEAAGRLRRTSASYPALTQRERVVLHHLASGGTIPAIADRLSVSANTIKSQVRSLYRKLNASNREEALRTWAELQQADASI